MDHQTSVVWKRNSENQWALFSNSDYKLPHLNLDAPNTKETSKTPIDNPFHFTKTRTETKGTLAYTPKGYGIIHSLVPGQDTATVKVEGTVYELDKNQVMNEIPIQVNIIKGAVRTEESMYMAVHSTATDVHNRIEASLRNDEDEGASIKLYYQGKELEKSGETFEKLKVTPLAKFLVIPSMGKPLKINRFPTINQGWYYDQSSVDGIAVTPSKNIRLKGYSLYRGEGTQELLTEIKIITGDNTNGVVLYQESVHLTKDQGGPDDKIFVVMLNKPLTFKAGETFSLTFTCKQGHSHYGSAGKTTSEGEGEVSFTFRECTGAHNGTSATSGQFPELYYYL